jgi:RNA polymerase sigma-70 factor (ECF subfamily)
LDDQTLVAAVLAGDPTAEREFYDAHVDRVYRMAYRMTGNEATAEDLTQETFVKAFNGLRSFRGDSAVSTWLHSVAMSVIISGLRKLKRYRERETELEPVELTTPAPAMGNPHLRVRLTRAIDNLSDKLRVVFIMHDLEGFKHREIAEILDIGIETSKVRLMRAHEKLREELAPLAP